MSATLHLPGAGAGRGPSFQPSRVRRSAPLPHAPHPHLLAAGPQWRPDGPCAIAVGNFDGVHRGHARIVASLRATGERLGLPTAAFTFDPHPARILRPDSAPPALTTPERRAELLMALGVDAVLLWPIDPGTLALGAEAFYGDVLRGAVGAAAIVEGPDFRFGAGRRGDMALLRRLAEADGVEVVEVEAERIGGQPVSSSRIRALVAAGDVAGAAALLTAPHRIEGVVVHGQARGRTLGFPTANLSGIATLVPGAGVYAGRARIDGGAAFPAAVHVGAPVSFGATEPTVEVHLVGFAGDCYGRGLDVDFLTRLRDTRRFASLDELKAQLAADVASAAALGA